MNKKFLAKLLIFCLVFTMLPVSAFAADEATVGNVTYTIAWDTTASNPTSVVAGKTADYKANVTYGTGQDAKVANVNVTYTSSDADIADFSEDGTLNAKTAGNIVVTASADIGSGISVTMDVEITATEVAVTSVTLDSKELTLVEGKTATLTATVAPANATDKTVTWTTSNEAVATVANGVVTAIAEGEAIITATAGGKNATCTIKVEPEETIAVTTGDDDIPVIGGNTVDANDVASSGEYILDVATPVPGATAVNVEKTSIDAIVNADNVTITFTVIKLATADIKLPQAALQAIQTALKADGAPDKVEISIEDMLTGTTTNDYPTSTVVALDVNVKVGDDNPFRKDADNNHGTLTLVVKRPTTMTDDNANLNVYYVNKDTNAYTYNASTTAQFSADGKQIEVTVNHLSEVIVTTESISDATDENPNTPDPGPGPTGGGGGSSSSNVTIASKVTGGTVSISPSRPNRGQTVTINVKPATGYKLDTLTVTDKDGNKLELTKVSDDKYTFVMPAGKVTVTPTFVKTDSTENPGTSTGLTFSDVKADAWYAEYIAYVVEKGMMNGYEDGRFGPNDSTTRAQIVTVLYRLEGEPATSSASFRDVSGGQYYSNAVAWAANNGIVKGYENGAFGPSDNVTREQIAAILYRYAEYKEYDVTATGNVNNFSDSAKVSSWATDAMNWAIGEGLINGDNGALRPQGNATRAEIATLLTRFCENIAK